MKIVVTPIAPDATGTGHPAVTLGDDSVGDLIVDPPLLPQTKRVVQTDAIAFADRESVIGRGNRNTSFSWTVTRSHADAATASAFRLAHEKDVPVNVSIAVIEGGTTASFTSGVISGVAFTEHFGSSTTCRYMVEGAVPA